MSNKQFHVEKKKYIKEVKACFISDLGTRNKFIRDLKSDIDEFVESNSVSDFSAVRNHFGEPRDIAKGFLENADIKKIKGKMNVTKAIVAGVIITHILWAILLLFVQIFA